MHNLRAKALSEIATGLIHAEEIAAAQASLQKPLSMPVLQCIWIQISVVPMLFLGISLAGLEQYDEAKRQCQRAIRLQPENAEVRWYLGRILICKGSILKQLLP